METFLKQISASSSSFMHKLNAQRSHPIQKSELTTIEDDYLVLVEKTGRSSSTFLSAIVGSSAKEPPPPSGPPPTRFGNENSNRKLMNGSGANWYDLKSH